MCFFIFLGNVISRTRDNIISEFEKYANLEWTVGKDNILDVVKYYYDQNKLVKAAGSDGIDDRMGDVKDLSGYNASVIARSVLLSNCACKNYRGYNARLGVIYPFRSSRGLNLGYKLFYSSFLKPIMKKK